MASRKVLWLVLLLCLCYFPWTECARKRKKEKSKNKSKSRDKEELARIEGLRFEQPIYATDIREDIAVGAVVLTVRAESHNEGK